MNTYFASHDCSQFSTPQKIVYFRYILIHLKDNPLFPNPTVKLSTIANMIDSLEMLNINNNINPNKIFTDLIQRKEKNIEDLLNKQAAYVNKIAKGNFNIIIKSGFYPLLKRSQTTI